MTRNNAKAKGSQSMLWGFDRLERDVAGANAEVAKANARAEEARLELEKVRKETALANERAEAAKAEAAEIVQLDPSADGLQLKVKNVKNSNQAFVQFQASCALFRNCYPSRRGAIAPRQ
jgi:hypothetical protein